MKITEKSFDKVNECIVIKVALDGVGAGRFSSACYGGLSWGMREEKVFGSLINRVMAFVKSNIKIDDYFKIGFKMEYIDNNGFLVKRKEIGKNQNTNVQ